MSRLSNVLAVPRDWVAQWAVDARWAAGARIFYAVSMLFLWPPTDSRTLGGLDDSLWHPPLGPFMFLDGYPSEGVLVALEAVAAGLLVALAAGLFTRAVGISFGLVELFLAGVRYSTGKIDHDLIVLVGVPIIMSFSNWGKAFSLDAIRRSSAGKSTETSDRPWAVGVLALALAVEFSTAGFVKAFTGWLSTEGSTVHAWVAQYVFVLNPNMVSSRAVALDAPVLWEFLDISTVVFEIAALAAVATRSWTRLYVVVAMTFHLGIVMLLGIDFAKLIVVYAILLLPPPRRRPSARPPVRSPLVLVGAFGAVAAATAVMTAVRAGSPGTSVLSSLSPFPAPFTAAFAIMVVFLLVSLFATVRLAPHTAHRVEERLRGWWAVGLAAGLSIISAACTLLVSEPYPSLTGPLFWGQRADASGLAVVRSVITVEDASGEQREITAAALYGVAPHFAFNLVAFQFPVEKAPRGWIDRVDQARMDTQGFAFLATPRHPAPGSVSSRWCEELADRLPEARAISVTWVETRYQNASAVSTRELSRYDLRGPESLCGG